MEQTNVELTGPQMRFVFAVVAEVLVLAGTEEEVLVVLAETVLRVGEALEGIGLVQVQEALDRVGIVLVGETDCVEEVLVLVETVQEVLGQAGIVLDQGVLDLVGIVLVGEMGCVGLAEIVLVQE